MEQELEIISVEGCLIEKKIQENCPASNIHCNRHSVPHLHFPFYLDGVEYIQDECPNIQ